MTEENMGVPVNEPTMEQPKVQPAEKSIDVDAIIAACEKAGVTNPKVLEGKFEASRQAGNLANQLGDARAQLDYTNRELAELKAMIQGNSKKKSDNYDSFDDVQSINLREEIVKGVKQVVTELQVAQQRAQQQARERTQQVTSKILGDRYYPAVKELWEAKLNDPAFVSDIQSGRVDPVDAYRQTVIDFQGELLGRSVEAFKQTKGVVPPSMETQTRGQQQGNLVSENPVNTSPSLQKQKELLAKVDKGYRATDDEIIDTFDDILNRALS